MEEAVSLKDRANALFAQQQFAAALQLYDEALRAVTKDAVGREQKDLHCTLLTNRATCLMQLKLFKECVEECNAALKLDGRRTKTMYRRAQAYEEMGKLEEALKDLRVCVQLEPENKPAILAARRVRDALTKEMEGRTPVYQVLEVLKGSQSDAKALQSALHSLVGLTADSVGAALEVKQRGGLPLLWKMMQQDSQALDAMHVLAACCNHTAFVSKSFDPTSGETSLSLKELQGLTQSADIGMAKAAVVLMLRIAKHWPVESAGDLPEDVVKAVFGAWTSALAHDNREVRMAGMEALVTWLSTRMDEKNGSEEVMHALEGDTLKKLVSLFECKDQGERQKAALALGRLWALLRGTPEKIKRLFLELVPEKGKPSADGFDLRSAERTLLLITGLAYADNGLAVWALEDASKDDDKAIADTKGSRGLEADGRAHIHTVFLLIMAPVESSQEIAAELVNLVVSTDGGRNLLGSLVSSDVFMGLLESPNPTVKAAAASAYTKQGLAAKALTSDSREVTQLLNVAADELRRAPLPLPPAKQKKLPVPTTTTSDDKPKADGRSLERAVEVLSCLVTRTSLKDEITFGSGRCVPTLPLLLEKAKDGRSSSSYGLSFILASITLSNEQLRDEALAERDITKEQFEQLQNLQKMQTPDGNEANKDALEADPPQRVQKRVQELVKLGGIRALCRLADGAGLSTQEQIAMAFAEIATVEKARGSLLQEGGYNACMELATEAHPEKTRTRAIHAIAKCLVTTNPHVLSERQRMNPIPPMLWLCRQSNASNLQHFECLLGLTNLASAGDEVRNAIAANKGVPAIQYLQYSEHPMVRRAATEALCNMATHPEGIANFRNAERLKFWLALANDYEEDPATAQAAMGALATAAADEGVSEALTTDEDGIERIKSILSSGVVNMVYRAAVAVGYMVGFEKSRDKLLSKDILACLKSPCLQEIPEEVGSALRFAIDALEQAPSQLRKQDP